MRQEIGCGGADKWTVVPGGAFPGYSWSHGSGNLFCDAGHYCPNTTVQVPAQLRLCCAVRCPAVPCGAMLCCAVLCCAVLCCAMLCYAMLCGTLSAQCLQKTILVVTCYLAGSSCLELCTSPTGCNNAMYKQNMLCTNTIF